VRGDGVAQADDALKVDLKRSAGAAFLVGAWRFWHRPT